MLQISNESRCTNNRSKVTYAKKLAKRWRVSSYLSPAPSFSILWISLPIFFLSLLFELLQNYNFNPSIALLSLIKFFVSFLFLLKRKKKCFAFSTFFYTTLSVSPIENKGFAWLVYNFRRASWWKNVHPSLSVWFSAEWSSAIHAASYDVIK